jgi:predicted PurR-regulated permease PerM
MLPEDRAYLLRLVSATTGLAQPDAERRVAEVSASAKENIERACRSAAIIAFMTAAVAALGTVVSWFAAEAAGWAGTSSGAPRLGQIILMACCRRNESIEAIVGERRLDCNPPH